MTAHPHDQLGDASLLRRAGAGPGLGGVALVTVIAILFVVAAAVLATVEWIAPASAGTVPG